MNVSKSARIKIKVIPNASQDQVVGWLGTALKLRVRAQPEKGKANLAVVILLADLLEVPVRTLAVTSGNTSQYKIIEITGLSNSELKKKLTNVNFKIR